MLKKRLIPKLQMMSSRFGEGRMVIVTTHGFSDALEIGDPVAQAKIYEAQAADELVFLNIRPSDENRSALTAVISRVAEEIFVPIAVGGGVTSLEDFRHLLASGADKVCVNTAAVRCPDLINRASDVFGAQCVVLSIDYRCEEDGRRRAWSDGGTGRTDLDPVDWAVEGEKRGAGEILLTCIDRDGTRQGLDVATCREVADRVAVPVIAAGGCGLASHFVEGFLRGGASAVSAGTYFCVKDENPMQTRARINNAGIPIRIHT